MPKAPALELYGRFNSDISSHECMILQPKYYSLNILFYCSACKLGVE